MTATAPLTKYRRRSGRRAVSVAVRDLRNVRVIEGFPVLSTGRKDGRWTHSSHLAVAPPRRAAHARARRLALALATTLTAVGALAGGIAASSHTGSATLSNGAQLAVSIDSPATGTEYVGTSVDVPVTGTASVGLGEADATIVYVMDFSGSTGATPGGSTCGTILDCEKAFFVGLNAAAVADGSTDEVAVVKFGSSSSLALALTNPDERGGQHRDQQREPRWVSRTARPVSTMR